MASLFVLGIDSTTGQQLVSGASDSLTGTVYIGTTAVALARASATLNLAGIGTLGCGAITSIGKLDITLTTEQLRLGYDASNYLSMTVASTGGTTFGITSNNGAPTYIFDKTIKTNACFQMSQNTHDSGLGVGRFILGSVNFLHNFNYGDNGVVTTNGGNAFFGGAGNFTMGSTATHTWDASNNVGIGLGALGSNTTGNSNLAIGTSALFGNTDGYYNIAIGANNCLFANTTGNFNVAIGSDALANLTTVSNNTSIGTYSGRYYGSGTDVLTTPNNSVFIGYDARALTDGNANEIVIGAGTIGAGSNTVTLGNTSITSTVLRGAITTAVPTGGTVGAWKLGILVTTASLYDATRYIQVDVNGTLYKLALCQ